MQQINAQFKMENVKLDNFFGHPVYMFRWISMLKPFFIDFVFKVKPVMI